MQEKKPIKALLKLEGMEEFKKRVWQSMHLRSDMEEEEGIWTELIRRLREVCCNQNLNSAIIRTYKYFFVYRMSGLPVILQGMLEISLDAFMRSEVFLNNK